MDRHHSISPGPPSGAARPGPTNPFIEFKKEDIEQSIPERFEQQVRKYSQQLALRTNRHHLSYQVLDRAANRVARAILHRCGEAEEPVAFLLEHGAPQVIALLGILKAGKIYVPLDASFPRARTASMLEDSRARLIVTDRANLALAELLNPQGCLAVNCDATGRGADPDPPRLSRAPERPAYILYTSGSTGQPKGVVQSHCNVLHFTQGFTNSLHVGREDRLALLASFSFAASMSDLFAALLNGAALLPFDLKEEGLASLAGWLVREGVTVYHSVPTVFRRFAGTLTGAETFPHLRLIRLGGEAVSRKDVELYQKYFGPNCLMAVTFAATETGAIRQYFLDTKTCLSGSRVPVGYPLDDKEVRVLDDAGAEVGPDGVGEIAVKSPYLALGYWRDPELTHKAFRPDQAGSGARVYRTGDLGVLRPDGCLEHLGRKDFQVKVRGHRVEVAEIETALLDLGNIKEAAVVGREDPSGGQRLVAYVVPGAGPAPTVSVLRQALRARLPDYLIPSAFVLLDALPATPTGKVNREALPAPDTARPALANVYLPPTNPVQTLLTQIWAQCLNVRPIGIQDHFYDLGGDSLRAVEMLAEVEARFGKKLSTDVLLAGATVAHMENALREGSGSRTQSLFVEVQGGDAGQRFFYLHGDMDAGGIYCSNLARYLGKDQPLYVFHPHGLTGNLVPPTLEAMAADYLRTLVAFQAQGPYLLGGFCYAGVIAVEMARLLVHRGQRVDLVVLVSPPPRGRLAAVPPAGGVAGAVPPSIDLSAEPPEQRPAVLTKLYQTALQSYFLKAYPVRVAVFQPLEDQAAHGSPLEWKEAAQEAEIHFVPGGHFTVITRHIQTLAAAIRESIRKARPRPAGNH